MPKAINTILGTVISSVRSALAEGGVSPPEPTNLYYQEDGTSLFYQPDGSSLYTQPEG